MARVRHRPIFLLQRKPGLPLRPYHQHMGSLICTDVVQVTHVTSVDDGLRAELLDCWVEVSNAGGAVGFVPPVDAAKVTPVLAGHLTRIAAGAEVLVVVREESRLAGFAFVQLNSEALWSHWATVRRVQVRPGSHGGGLGTRLMQGVHDVARSLGLEMLRLSARGGTGVEQFYLRLGYREYGRMPGGIRVAPGDDRDDILLFTRL